MCEPTVAATLGLSALTSTAVPAAITGAEAAGAGAAGLGAGAASTGMAPLMGMGYGAASAPSVFQGAAPLFGGGDLSKAFLMSTPGALIGDLRASQSHPQAAAGPRAAMRPAQFPSFHDMVQRYSTPAQSSSGGGQDPQQLAMLLKLMKGRM